MPNCFTLSPKTDKDTKSAPIKFNVIDDKMCKDFGIEPHRNHYYCGWYDVIGWRLAHGDSFDEIRAEFQGRIDDLQPLDDLCYLNKMLKIVSYLDQNYISNAWYGR